MREIGISLDFKNSIITWDNLRLDMKFKHMREHNTIISQSKEPNATQEMTARATRILDSKNKKADLEQITKNTSHLSSNEQQQLYQVLKKHETLFNGTLGTWNTQFVRFTMKEEAKTHSHQYYSTPRTHQETFKKELDELVKIGVLKEVRQSQWGSLAFIIPKKDGRVRFISDFQMLNMKLK